MKKPLWVYLTYPIHLATRGWLKYQCCYCEEDEYHHGMAAVMGWLRDRSINRSSRITYFRMKHRRFSRFLCFFGRHEAFVLSSDRLPPGSCVACKKLVKPDYLGFMGDEEEE